MVFRVLVLALVVVLTAPAASAASTAVALAPVEDVSFPFACSWGYDWEERCWRDDSTRLPIGGEDDKAWRTALRFSLGAVPRGAEIASAELELYYDRTCIGPYASSGRCDGRSFTIDAHPLLSMDWYDEREPELDPWLLARYVLPAYAGSRWMSWDLTGMAQDWHAGAVENAGVLLRLPDAQEWPAVGGPKPPSSSFASGSLRPRLVVVYEG
jgi:TGF-beta propeptide